MQLSTRSLTNWTHHVLTAVSGTDGCSIFLTSTPWESQTGLSDPSAASCGEATHPHCIPFLSSHPYSAEKSHIPHKTYKAYKALELRYFLYYMYVQSCSYFSFPDFSFLLKLITAVLPHSPPFYLLPSFSEEQKWLNFSITSYL